MTYKLAAIGSCLAIAVQILPNTAHAQTRPNIILILADDLGWSDTSNSRTNMGNPSDFYETPTLARLAQEGMAFTNAYTNGPNCAPTRSAILTGQYAPRPTNNIYLVQSLNRGGNNTLLVGPSQGLPGGQDAIPNSAITIAETLRTAGYRTAYAGKFHVTTDANSITNSHGFEYNFGGKNTGGPGDYHARNNRFGNSISPSLDAFAANYTQSYVDNNIKPFASNVSNSAMNALAGTNKHATDAVTDAAISFIKEQASSPLFLFLSHYAVHTPIGNRQARSDLLAKYRSKRSGRKDSNESFGALIEGMDQSIGRLIEYLKSTPDPRNRGQNLDKNTLVVFLSDNGGRLNQSNNGPLRGQKGELTEGGIRVPMIVWSGNSNLVRGGVTNSTPVVGTDLYETFRALASASRPSNYPLDGENLQGVFRNDSNTNNRLRNRPIYWHLPGYLIDGSRNQRPQSIVRRGNFKLIYNYESKSYSLYDLANDLSERNNLLASNPSSSARNTASELSKLLRDWLINVNAPLPTVRSTGRVVPYPSLFGDNGGGGGDNGGGGGDNGGGGGSSTLSFALGSSSGLGGQSSGQTKSGDTTLRLEARGANARFATNSKGLGVDSTLDSGSSSTQRRIDGTLATAEEVYISFDQQVTLLDITVGALSTNSSGSESFRLRFISGSNPFGSLKGFDNSGFQNLGSEIVFTATNNEATPLRVSFAGGNRTPMVIQAGTVISLTTSPTTSGGTLVNEIRVQR